MGTINFARVLIGGLVAGLILNIGEWLLNGMVLAQDMKDFFQKCGLPEPADRARWCRMRRRRTH